MYQFNEQDAYNFAHHIGAKTHRRGRELVFRVCPFCNEETRSNTDKFSINLTTGQYNCFRASCGAKGNMVTLSKTFGFKLEGYVDEYVNHRETFRKFKNTLQPKTTTEAIEYLKGRGISQEVAERYRISVKEGTTNIMVFPFYEGGEIVNCKFRKMDFDKTKDKNKEWFVSRCKPVLFGMQECDFESDLLVMTEGQIDSLSLSEAGIKNAVSVPNGCNGFSWIPYCWDFLHRFSRLIVFGDYEKGHITLLDEMRKYFNGGVFHVKEDNYCGCKDANEILQKYGREQLIKCVEEAVPYESPMIVKLADVRRANIDGMQRITSGLRSVDKIIGGFFLGQVAILTGERGKGKSTLASQFGMFAINKGIKTFFYSGELEAGYFKNWLDLQIAGKEGTEKVVSDESEFVSYRVKDEFTECVNGWYRNFAFLYNNNCDDDDAVKEVVPVIREAVIQYGCEFVIIDNLMTAIDDDLNADIYRMQTEFVKKVVRLAKEMHIFILLIAHPKKAQAGSSSFTNDDVLGSSNITNLVDVVMRYDEPRSEMRASGVNRCLYITKNRLTGRTAFDGLPLYYEEQSKRISDSQNFSFDLNIDFGNDGFADAEEVETPFVV